jgi:hypothetical protein
MGGKGKPVFFGASSCRMDRQEETIMTGGKYSDMVTNRAATSL